MIVIPAKAEGAPGRAEIQAFLSWIPGQVEDALKA